ERCVAEAERERELGRASEERRVEAHRQAERGGHAGERDRGLLAEESGDVLAGARVRAVVDGGRRAPARRAGHGELEVAGLGGDEREGEEGGSDQDERCAQGWASEDLEC